MSLDQIFKLEIGDCIKVLKSYPDNYFHSIVTDPPYNIKINALGKKGRKKAASRKRRQDPKKNRRGKAKNVKTK